MTLKLHNSIPKDPYTKQLCKRNNHMFVFFSDTVKTVVHMLLIRNLEKCLVHPGINHKNERGQAIFTALVINSKKKYTYKDVLHLVTE